MMKGCGGSKIEEGTVRISTGVADGWRTIQITEAEPDQRAALDELGHPADVVHRYPPGTMHFERAVANLRQGLDEMVRQRIDKTPADWAAAFRDLLSRAEWARVPFAVVGSVALAVRGVDVRPGDIDVLTTPDGADALGEAYRDDLVVPVATEPGFGRWGRAFAGGIRVEWLGTPAGVQEGPWPLNAAEWSVASPFDEIRWENRSLRVPPLELQRRVEVQRQRRDRVAAIDAFTTGRRAGSRR
jgi:hypothetical protein